MVFFATSFPGLFWNLDYKQLHWTRQHESLTWIGFCRPASLLPVYWYLVAGLSLDFSFYHMHIVLIYLYHPKQKKISNQRKCKDFFFVIVFSSDDSRINILRAMRRNPVYCSWSTNNPPPHPYFYFFIYAYFRIGSVESGLRKRFS